MSRVSYRTVLVCRVPMCERDAITRDMCWVHYQHARKYHHDPRKCGVCLTHDAYVFPVVPETCTEPGCSRKHYARGMCAAHYRAERRSRGLN